MLCWKIVETKKGAVILPKRGFKGPDYECPEFRCCQCGHKLYLHHFTTGYEPVKKFYHVDVHLKCPLDSHFVTYGVAISKEEYDRLSKSKLNSVDLTNEHLEVEELNEELSEEDEKIIRKRLEQMGYWGG